MVRPIKFVTHTNRWEWVYVTYKLRWLETRIRSGAIAHIKYKQSLYFTPLEFYKVSGTKASS